MLPTVLFIFVTGLTLALCSLFYRGLRRMSDDRKTVVLAF